MLRDQDISPCILLGRFVSIMVVPRSLFLGRLPDRSWDESEEGAMK